MIVDTSDTRLLQMCAKRKLLLQQHSHNCYFNELLEQHGSFHEVLTQAEFSHYPVVHFVEMSQKSLQISCGGAWEFLPSKNVVDKLCL